MSSINDFQPTVDITNIQDNAINLDMPLSLATNTSINKSNIVKEFNIPYTINNLPPCLKNNSNLYKIQNERRTYLDINQENISIWSYDIVNNHKYGKERMPLQRSWAIEDGLIRDSYSRSYYNMTKHYEKQYKQGMINIYRFIDIVNNALTAMETECYYNYHSASFIEKKHWHYIENIWIMHQKLKQMYTNLLQTTKSSLPKHDNTQYILKSSITTMTKPKTETKQETEAKPEPVDSKCIIM